jgi:hypothetical protein
LTGFEIYICKGILLTVLCKLKVLFLLTTTIVVVLIVILISAPNQQGFSQTSGGVVTPPQSQLESIKILNLMPFQSVDLNKELLVSGESSDTSAKDCSVYVIVNGVQPYQSAIASGTAGATDFSQWKFVLHEQYTHLNEGNNKITAKLVCTSAPTRWYSVVVNGLSSSNLSQKAAIDTTQQSNVSEAPIDTTQKSEAPIDTTQQSNVSEAPIDTTQKSEAPIDTTQKSEAPIDTTQQSNVSEAPIDTTQQSNVSEAPIDTTQQSNVSEAPIDTTQKSEAPIDTTQQSNVSEAPIDTTQKSEAPIDTTQQSKLLVAILPLKNPVARGDSQNTTIIVTNSHNKPISNAQINGKLIYPGNNFEKEFKGITDIDGKFAYSWTVGKKGDIGPLVMEVQASSQGYPPASANISIELLKSGESSQIENPFQSLQSP